MGELTGVIVGIVILFLSVSNYVERKKNLELIRELAILSKANTVNEFAKYEEKDVEIPDDEDDNDFSSYVSISEATPDELRNATINLTPFQK